MNCDLEPGKYGETSEVCIRNPGDLKDVIRTDLDTVTFAFASRMVDNGHKRTGCGFALCSGPVRVLCGPPNLVSIGLFRHVLSKDVRAAWILFESRLTHEK